MINLLHFDPIALIQAFGYLGIFAIIFADSGLFFGFFLPGDSLLFAAGLLASQGVLHIPFLVLVVVIAAIVGDNAGYWFGARVGPRIFTRDESLFFSKKHIERTKNFYITYGSRAVVIARFVPVVRTFTPILAGVGQMRYREFLRYNIIGGVLWGAGVPLIGYSLGRVIPNLEHYLTPIILGIIVISFIPVVREVLRARSGTPDR